MADLHVELTVIADAVRRTTVLESPAALRTRVDRRHRRRVTGASGLAVLAVAGGVAGVTGLNDRPAMNVFPERSPVASASVPVGGVLSGTRLVSIEVAGMAGAVLALGRGDDDQVRATPGLSPDTGLWIVRPVGRRYQIVLATLRGTSEVCMTVVHDAPPGSVRDRVCDRASAVQQFTIDRAGDGNYSLFNGRRYVQVVDGTNALVPDLPEALTTTYVFRDHGPAPR